MAGFDDDEFRRWYGQAEHTLASAERDAKASDFGWACFKAQAGIAVSDELSQLAETLDRHSIPRHPDAFPTGMPYEFYDQPTANAAIDAARRLVAFVHEQAMAMGVAQQEEGAHTSEEVSE